jgi:hypothetical protein
MDVGWKGCPAALNPCGSEVVQQLSSLNRAMGSCALGALTGQRVRGPHAGSRPPQYWHMGRKPSLSLPDCDTAALHDFFPVLLILGFRATGLQGNRASGEQ